MKSTLALFFLCVSLAAMCGAAEAATYYVSTAGDDSSDGSDAKPWRTIQHAVDTIAPGDTVIVREGTYQGFRIGQSGEEGRAKTVKAEKPGAVTLNEPGSANKQSGVLEVQKPGEVVGYWAIDGFKVTAGGKYRAIDMRHTTHITVRNCESDGSKARTTGIYASYAEGILLENNISHNSGEHGIYVANGSDNGVFRGNKCYDTAGAGIQINADATMPNSDGISSNFLIEKNISHDTVLGLNMDGVEKSTFRNNLIYRFSDKGLTLFAIDAAIASRNNRVLNNTLVSREDGKSYFCVTIRHTNAPEKPAPVGNKLFNNIFYHYGAPTTVGSLNIDKTGFEGFESDYNVVMDYFGINDNETHENLSEWRARGYDAHSIQAAAAAIFVAPAAYDFHLKADSPARGAGTALPDVTDDLEGRARPQGKPYDIGCYEHSAS